MIRPLVLGGMVYGQTFLDIFERFCAASLRAPANLEALRSNGAKVALYTDRQSSERLKALLADLLPYDLWELTPNPNDRLYETLGAVHYVLTQRTADEGRAFHMMMPDQMYSERYFPNLFRMAVYGDVLHNTINAHMSAAPDLEPYRDGRALTVPARDLGDITWRHLHPRMGRYLMNRAKVPVSMPRSLDHQHIHLWRARDRVMLFSPNNTPVYLTPETARHYPKPALNTLDGQIQWMVGNFVCPGLEDDMAMVCIEHAEAKGAPDPDVDWATFASECWLEIGYQPLRLQYFRKPTLELHASVIEGLPTAEDVLRRQGEIADGIEEWGVIKSQQAQERGWEAFMAGRRKTHEGARP